MFAQSVGASETSRVGSTAEKLNAQSVSAEQLKAASEILADLPSDTRNKAAAQTLALQSYAAAHGFVDAVIWAAAVRARVTALSNWTAENDPNGQSDAKAIVEAAASFPMSDGDLGIAFDPVGFQEMILFIEELPW